MDEKEKEKQQTINALNANKQFLVQLVEKYRKQQEHDGQPLENNVNENPRNICKKEFTSKQGCAGSAEERRQYLITQGINGISCGIASLMEAENEENVTVPKRCKSKNKSSSDDNDEFAGLNHVSCFKKYKDEGHEKVGKCRRAVSEADAKKNRNSLREGGGKGRGKRRKATRRKSGSIKNTRIKKYKKNKGLSRQKTRRRN